MSALIFVALAVAWAAYLIPKALRHHGDASETRAVETFSDQMRVVARREPTSATSARLVVAGAESIVAGPEEVRARRVAAARATRRRRRVLSLILIACVVVGGLAANSAIQATYAAIPAGLLVAWLIACRVMVKSERRRLVPVTVPASAVAPTAEAVPAAKPVEVRSEVGMDDDTTSIPRVPAQAGSSADPTLWDPVPVTLPTYVTKPAAARRTVRSIDLESSGVWTSGRTEVASRIAREAERAERRERSERTDDAESVEQNQAVGS